jgi:plastocyanin
MSNRLRGLLGLTVTASLVAGSLAAQTRATLVRQADLIFVGTVTAVAAASVAGVPVTQRTLTVRVDGVLDKPAAVQVAPGDTVTVEARAAGTLQVGAQVTFYTKAWLFGCGVAAQEVGHEMVSARWSAAALGPLRDSVLRVRGQMSDSALRARIRAADMVVVGRVEAIQAASLAAVPARRRITEHDPVWQEAVIQVETMIKGTAPSDQRVVVRFPGSLDVAWRGMPRFTVGQEGTFLLRRDQLSGSPTAMISGRQVTAYAAPTTQDVLTKLDASRVQALTRP